MRVSRPAEQKAVQYLRALLGSFPSGRQCRLPTTRSLAAAAGVAHFTMWKAVQRLVGEGRLSAKPGLGIVRRIAGETGRAPGAGASLPGPRKRAWELLADRMRADISQGIYAAGQVLPSLKVAIDRHGTSRHTYRQALADLAAEGLVEPYRRGYRVAIVRSAAQTSSIAVVGRGDPDGTLARQAPWTHEVLVKLEDECRARGFGTEHCAYDYDRSGRLLAVPRKADLRKRDRSAPALFGIVVLPLGLGRSLSNLLLDLFRLTLPVSLWMETRTLSLPRDLLTRNRLKVFTRTSNFAAGQAVGRHLAASGHRTVAYVSPFHQPDHGDSHERLEGLRQGLAGLSPAVSIRVYTRGTPASETQADTVDLRRRAAEALSRTARPAGGSDVGRVLAALGRHVDIVADGELRRPLSEELAREALAQPDVTCLVGYNDAVAFHCLDLLSAAGRSGVTVVGFDDTEEACFRGLSSYNFNLAGLARAMVSHILVPGSVRRQAVGPVAIDGYMSIR